MQSRGQPHFVLRVYSSAPDHLGSLTHESLAVCAERNALNCPPDLEDQLIPSQEAEEIQKPGKD